MIELDKKYKKILYICLITTILFFVLLNLNFVFEKFIFLIGIISPFIIGLVIAFICNLPMSFIRDKIFKKFIKNKKYTKVIDIISMIISYLILLITVVILLYILIPQLIKSISQLISKIPEFSKLISKEFNKYPFMTDFAKRIQKSFSDLSMNDIVSKSFGLIKDSGIFKGAGGIFSSVMGSLTAFFLGFVFSIYVLINRKKLKIQTERMLYSIFKETTADYLMHISKLNYEVFSNYIVGQVTDAIILGILCFVSMLIFKIPYAGMISVIVGFSDLIPIFGPIVGTVISALFILIESPFKAFIFIVMLLLLQQIQGNIIYPFIVGNKVGLPAMWTLVAISLGGSLFGIIGMMTFVPLTSVIYVLLGEFTNYMLKQKNINIEEKNKENKINETAKE